jgi:hypothetical protein
MMNYFYHKIDTKGQNLTKRRRKRKKLESLTIDNIETNTENTIILR